MDDPIHPPRRRWLGWVAQAFLILLTLGIVWAILLPVFKGVSDDPRPRDPMGLPIDRPFRAGPRR